MPENPNLSSTPGHARSSRYGGSHGSYRVFKRGITANESAPTTIEQGTRLHHRFDQCRWAIQKPPSVTAYDVHFMRWVSVVDDEGNDVIAGYYVEEDSATGLSDHLVADQDNNGDVLSIYIDGIAGGTGSGFVVMRKGVSKRA